MKKLIFVSTLFSFSSFANVSLESQIQKQSCFINSSRISISQSFDNGNLKAQYERPILLSGLDEVATAAAKNSRGVHSDENKYFVTVKNEKFVLNPSDSAEAKTLVRMMSKLCN